MQKKNYGQQGRGVISILAILLFLFLFQNCSRTPENSSVVSSDLDLASQSTSDLNGAWTLDRLDCYDSLLTKVTETAFFTNGYNESLIISGSTLKKNISQGSCLVSCGGNITFQNYYLTQSNLVVSKATNGSCIINASHSNSGILPTDASITFSTNEKILPAAQNFHFLMNKKRTPEELAILADFSGANQEYCFKVYQKQ